MAAITTVKLVDDIDGGKADETVEFSIDGHAYEIDLTTKSAAACAQSARGVHRARPQDEPRPRVRRRPLTAQHPSKADGIHIASDDVPAGHGHPRWVSTSRPTLLPPPFGAANVARASSPTINAGHDTPICLNAPNNPNDTN